MSYEKGRSLKPDITKTMTIEGSMKPLLEIGQLITYQHLDFPPICCRLSQEKLLLLSYQVRQK